MTTTFTSAPFVSLLDRLYEDAARTERVVADLFGHLSNEERRTHMANPDADYRAFYGRAREVHMPVSRATGRLLYLLARGARARHVVEYGTSFGLSTLHLAAALRDNGGGKLIGSELEPKKVAEARANLDAAGLGALVDLREGDALETLACDLPAPIDLVLLDGHKGLYPQILALLAPQLRAGAYVVADNAEACPAYLAEVRAPGGAYLSLAWTDEVELSMKL